MVGAGVGLCSYIVYASQTRESVVFKKSNKTLSQSMDLLNPKALKVSKNIKTGSTQLIPGIGQCQLDGPLHVRQLNVYFN